MAPFVDLPPPPPPSDLTSFIQSNTPAKSSPHNSHYSNLASQILHNLQYQHDWTSLQTHTHSPLSQSPLARPLVSGNPPRRIYVHPDEQVEMLTAGVKETDVPLEREWVLPTHLREKWSLRKFAEVFDAVGKIPPGEGDVEHSGDVEVEKVRRGGKRVLLAIVGDDSTVVYYIVHDSIVKPRQN